MNASSQMVTVRFAFPQLQEFLRAQIKRLVELGYHTALGMAEGDFSVFILKTAGRRLPEFLEAEENQLPILLVIPFDVLPLETQLKLLGIQSDHGGPIWDIEGTITSPQPYLVFGPEYSGFNPPFSPEFAPERLKASRWQAVTFAQGIAMLAQFDELQEHCEGLIFAGSYWHVGAGIKIKCVGEYSCLEGERRIMSQAIQATRPCSHFGLCLRNPTISAGSGEGADKTL